MQDHYYPFHLFGAVFASATEAQQYVFEQWEPEPPEDATDAEYAAWEERNPTWRLAEELEFYIDSDFVELADSLANVISQIRSADESAWLSTNAKEFSHFIIISDNPDAIWADRRPDASQTRPVIRPPESTATLTYLGRFN
jgi:hypothetical protein